MPITIFFFEFLMIGSMIRILKKIKIRINLKLFVALPRRNHFKNFDGLIKKWGLMSEIKKGEISPI